jgi:hypothetical protein
MGKKKHDSIEPSDGFWRKITKRKQAMKATMRLGFIMEASPEVAEDILTLANDIASYTGNPNDFDDVVERVSYNLWHYIRDEPTMY